MRNHSDLPADAQEALRAGRKIEAIRILREYSGLGLKEAKDIVDKYERMVPGLGAQRRGANDTGIGRVVFVLLCFAAIYFSYRYFM